MSMMGKVRRMHFREGKSVREIARLTSLARNTVRAWLREPEVRERRYRRSEAPTQLTPYAEGLRQALTADACRPKPDRRTVKALFEEIRAQGYAGCYSRVTDFVRAWRAGEGQAAARTAFVPLAFEWGEAYQFDWSEEGVVVGGVYYRVQVAHLMACHAELSRRLNLDIWFCDPHAPWQRGSNENTNGLLRQFLPKGADLSQVSQTQLNDIARLMNGRPRKTLNWKTPEEAMAKEMAEYAKRVALDS